MNARKITNVLVAGTAALALLTCFDANEAYGQSADQAVDQERAEAAAGAVERELRRNNVTINPLGLIVGGFDITYSRALHRKVSLDLSLTYVMPLFVPFHGVGGEIGIGIHPRSAFSGAFINIFASVSRTFVRDEGNLIGTTDGGNYLGVIGVTPGVEAGYRWQFDSGFNIGLGGGIGWGFAVWSEDCPRNAVCETQGDGFKFFLVLDMGVAA